MQSFFSGYSVSNVCHVLEYIFLRNCRLFLTQRNANHYNSIADHKIVRFEHKQLDKLRTKVYNGARRTSAFEKKSIRWGHY